MAKPKCKSSYFTIPGFSLIELLVVIAIIGILATIGLVGYQAYITTVKDDVGISNTKAIARLLDNDHKSITYDLNVRSEFANGLRQETLCKTQVDQLVSNLNVTQEKINPHDPVCGFAFNGNRAWSSANYLDSVNSVNAFDGCPVSVTSDTILVPRGRMMIACVDNNAAIDSTGYRLFTCHCSGVDTCETTNVGSDCNSSPFLGYATEAECRLNWMDHADRQGHCPSPGLFN